MKKKRFEYGLIGLLIGSVLGIIAGFGELNWIKKSQRGALTPYVIGITIVVGAQ